jgi:hypothetical protein
VWLRDLDGTGSMHPCTPHDDGALLYVREGAGAVAAYLLADEGRHAAQKNVGLLLEALSRAIKWLAVCNDPRSDADLHAAEAAIRTVICEVQ